MDPQQRAMLNDAYGIVKSATSKPYEAYGGDTLAGFNQDQLGAFDMVRNGIASNIGGNTLNRAVGGTTRALNYQPMQVTGVGYNPATMQAASAGPAATMTAANFDRGGVRDLSGGTILDRDIGAYMNPFLQNVASNAMSDLERTRLIQMNQGAGAATAAGAFGGSRHGVADAETNRNFFDVAGRTLTNLYASGYDNALNLARGDVDRDFEAQRANQGMDFNVGNINAGFQQQANATNQAALNNMAQFNAGFQQDANAANQAAQNTASQFGASATNAANFANQNADLAGAQFRLGAANQLAGLSDQQRQQFFQNAALLEGVGDKQQAQRQAEMDDSYAKWLEAQNYDLNMAGFLGNFVNAMPSMGGTSTSTARPSTFDSVMNIGRTLAPFFPSDENIKSGRAPVSDEAVLEGFRNTPVEMWSYDPAKGGPDDGGARHIGPMAQGVAKNLGIGNGTSIPVVDMLGTQTSAIRALDKKVRKLEGKTKGKK